MKAFAPEDKVLVSPRHLAGAGLDRLADAIGPLIHLFGWQTEHHAASGHVALDSPEGSMFVDFTPGRTDGVWWTIAHHEPFWKVECTRQTPIEAVAALTQCLPQLLGDRRHADHIPLTTSSLADIAAQNYWAASLDGRLFTSPDGHCTLRRAPDTETAWSIEHSVHDGFDTHWSTRFTADAPPEAVTQFFAHMAPSAPVEREFREIPFLARDLGDALITPVRGAAVNPHIHHAATRAAPTRTARHR